MRLFSFLLCLVLSVPHASVGAQGLNLPVTFEDASLDYALTDFGGNASQIVADPTDASNQVVQSIKTTDAALWAGTTVGGEVGFATPIPFAVGATTMSVRVWSPTAGTPIRLKVEKAFDPTISVETEARTTVAMAWETLVFDFRNEAPGTATLSFNKVYEKASIFFNFGTDGSMAGEQTYYWDDMAFGGEVPPTDGLQLPVTFEDSELDYGLADFGGNASEIVADPTNPSNKVAQSTKTAGSEIWAGTSLGGGAGFTSLIPFAPGATTISLRVWSPTAGTPIRLKVEAANDPTITVETEVLTTVAMAWDTLIFDFSNQVIGTAALNFANGYNKASVFFNFGTSGTGETYYWDDMIFGGATPVDNTLCTGTSNEAAEGEFIDGFTYTFTTSGNTVTAIGELIEPRDGLVAFAHTYNPNFAEFQMSSVSGQRFAISFPDQTIGAEFNMAFKFAFAGGLSTSTIFTYTVGVGCVGEVLNLPVTFESAELDYGLTDFGGNASEIVVDPTNAGNTVAQSTKMVGSEIWAGTTIGGDAGFPTAIPFAAGATTLSVRVWSPTAGTPIRLKVEDSTNGGISVETEATTTVAMGWETLVFDFSNEATGTAALNLANSYNKASIFFNFGTSGTGEIYYWDDVAFGGDGPPPTGLTLPVTFEDAAVDYALIDFGGNASDIVADPTNGANTVVQTIKTPGSEVWAGTTVGGTVGFSSPIPFAAGATTMSVRVWSPTTGTPVLLKVEAASNPAISVETQMVTTVAGGWQTMVFDFTNQAPGTAALNLANSYNKASIFFNFGTSGTGEAYFWDDMAFGGGAPPPAPLELPVTFDDENVVYAYIDFGGNASDIVVDPTNGSNTVMQSIKTPGSEIWAGTTIGGSVGFGSAIPFAAGATIMSVRVWSPTAGTPIRLKVEAANDPAISVETEATTTMARAWETLVFDFSNQVMGTAALNLANSYNKASIFFNFGTSGTGETYFWDDMAFGGGAPPPAPLELPVTFDDEDVVYSFIDFGGNASDLIVDPTNASNMVMQSIKTPGSEIWAGTTVGGTAGFGSAIPFTASATTMSVRIWSPTAGTPIRLKVEAANDPAISVETEATTTTAMAWETLVFDFDNEAMGTAALNLANSYNKASIFFNFGTSGTGETYFWDDLAFGVSVSTRNPVFDASLFELRPNLVSESTVLHFSPQYAGRKEIRLFNAAGMLLKSYDTHAQDLQVMTADLAAGMYLVQVRSEGRFATQRMLKQ